VALGTWAMLEAASGGLAPLARETLATRIERLRVLDGVAGLLQKPCACHGSTYELASGSLVKGPATAPQPALEVPRPGRARRGSPRGGCLLGARRVRKLALKVGGGGADDLPMNSDGESTSFEEQFAAFSGQAPWEAEPEQPAVLLVPNPEPVHEPVPEPAPAPIEPVVPAAPPVSFDAFTPPVEPSPPAVFAAEPPTDVLLAELDKATETLSTFREEIGRVMGQQRTTEAELLATRSQLAQLEGQLRGSGEYARLEGELARQRELIATVRATLGELVSALDAS